MTLHLHHRKLITVALIFLTSWIVGTFAVHYFEQGHPIGENYFNALYFTVITTATIGFGDLVPYTVGGKIVTMLYAVFYVPLFLYTMNILFQSRFDRIRIEDEKLEHEMQQVEADVNAIMDNTNTEKKPRRRIASK
jgi:voltage-gated potassium channel